MSQAADIESRRRRILAESLLFKDLQRRAEKKSKAEAAAVLKSEEDAFDQGRAEVAARAAQQEFPINADNYRDDADVYSMYDLPPAEPAQIAGPPPLPAPPPLPLNYNVADYQYYMNFV